MTEVRPIVGRVSEPTRPTLLMRRLRFGLAAVVVVVAVFAMFRFGLSWYRSFGTDEETSTWLLVAGFATFVVHALLLAGVREGARVPTAMLAVGIFAIGRAHRNVGESLLGDLPRSMDWTSSATAVAVLIVLGCVGLVALDRVERPDADTISNVVVTFGFVLAMGVGIGWVLEQWQDEVVPVDEVTTDGADEDASDDG